MYVSGRATGVVITEVGEGEFTKNADVRSGGKGVVGARMEAHPAIPAEKNGAAHGLVGNNIHPNRERRGWCAVVVELDSHSGLLVGC